MLIYIIIQENLKLLGRNGAFEQFCLQRSLRTLYLMQSSQQDFQESKDLYYTIHYVIF